LAVVRLSGIKPMSAGLEIPRVVAISFSAGQNGSSKVMLIVCPENRELLSNVGDGRDQAAAI
jgi:hypothetical protein